MDKLLIRGGTPLKGNITISGAKNAALPLMAAALLSDQKVTLANLPKLADIHTMTKLLLQHGMEVEWNEGRGTSKDRTIALRANDITSLTAPYHLVCTMRASVLVLGPLLARFGEAHVSLPGGCAIGTRPIDMHLHALEAMGATIELSDGYVNASVKGRLKGATIAFDKVSVGATENILMAAALAEGETVLKNAAREPEIGDLAALLNKMGAEISGIGTDTLHIHGVPSLHGAEHAIVADRIEAGTYAVAAAMTGGEVELVGARLDVMEAVAEKLAEADVSVTETPRGLRVRRRNGILANIDITTQPYPGFPTDMQAQMMALLAVANGASTITETIFENRYMHVPELQRMGADIQVHGATATIRGVKELAGAEVMATDLRASVCMVLAALVARGETVINRIYHLDRGYECLEEKLSACGADIERVGTGRPALKKNTG